jgi:hypothetical protein
MPHELLVWPAQTENNEPYVALFFAPGVVSERQEQARSLAVGYGLSSGYGLGPLSDARAAAKKLARELRRLGWAATAAGPLRSRVTPCRACVARRGTTT